MPLINSAFSLSSLVGSIKMAQQHACKCQDGGDGGHQVDVVRPVDDETGDGGDGHGNQHPDDADVGDGGQIAGDEMLGRKAQEAYATIWV